ncbi:inverse autotransporter beta domain-containing protein [Salmonella enterica]|nr:inverse autotransporter beta domain-containing protein [Salmonella enterica]
MNRKKHFPPRAETLNGCVRFRRTLLFAAVLQAMLPALTACGDTVTSAQATPTAQKAQAAQKPAQKNTRPHSPFRVDREAAPAPQAATASRSPFRVDRDAGGISPSPAPVAADDLPSLGTDPAGQTGGGAGDELKSARQAVRLAQEHRDAQQDGAATLASAASTAGSLLKGPHPGQAAASMAEGMARGMALGKANQTLQDWFRHLGNARVQLNADSDFSLKNSAFDLLHPWWETPDNMLFSQGSLHRTDHRSQANLGFGWRHWTTGTAPRGLFHGDYMTGLNTFLDYDLSRDHARMGIGAEFWRDYLKMDANLYHRLTNWKNSPDLDDYEERPADGWDLRMEGWLPSYPQLGAKLEYEQYYGNQVALFDTDHLQSNPRAVTTDLTWTPFPLMTVSAGRRQGQNSHFETEFGVNFTLNPDLTWQQQTDPAAVAAMRTLAGSRHDFVERNNNIVLEYRKKTVIAIALPERVEGKSGMQYPLSVTVSKAKYGLQDIVWDDADFLAAGGKLTCTGSTACTVTMPPFHPGAENTYTVGAVAHDRKGNESERAQTTIAVTGVGVSAANSTMTPAQASLLADGVSTDTVTVVLKSGDNQPVTGLADQLALSGVLTPDHQVVDVKSGMPARASAPASGTPGLSTLKEDSAHPGTYTATLTAGTTAGKYALTLNLNHAPLLTTNVTLTDTMADISQSTLTADKNTVTASDGSDPANVVHFTVTLKDKAGKPVSREAGRLKLTTTSGVDTARLKVSDLREDGTQPGVYTGTLSSTLAVKALPVVLMVNGKNSGKTATVTVTPDAASADPALTVTKDNALADGTDRNTLTITVADRYGNPVGNPVVGLTVTPADHTSIAPQVTADAAGKAPVSLTSKLPGDKTVTATVTGSGNHRDQTVTFRADPSVTVKHLNIADGAGTAITERPVGTTPDSTFHLEATVLDGQGNAVAGMPVSWTLDQSACADTSTTAKLDKTLTDTDAKGVATATLTSDGTHKTCDRLTITAAVPGTAALTGHVKYIAEAKSAMVTKNTVTSPYTDYLADGKAHADYRAHVTDQYSNPVKGISVAWSGGKTAVFTAAGPVTTDDQGNATNGLTSTTVLQDVAPVATVNSVLKGSTTATADRKVNFVANAGTATLSGITVKDDAGKTVDTLPVGTTAASVFHASATVVDGNGNPVAGQNVTWSLDQAACGGTNEAKLSTVTATTDSAGHSTATVASISPYHVCSGLKLSAAVGTAGHKTTPLNYIAEEASANVKTVALPSGAKTTYTADGKDTATWNATVADQYGNAVSGETVTWGGVTGAQPKYAAATTTTDASGHTSNTMTSTTAATNVKATATVSSTTHTGTPVTATTPVTFTADASKATLTVTVTGSRQPTETDTSHTAATADGADLLTLHFKAVDGNGNAVTSTPVHYTTAVTDAGIVQNTLACTTNGSGECTSTVKTTKAGTYNVWVALVPDGAAQPVSPVKTALVFLAGPPDATNTTVSTDRSAANADNKETITVTLTPRDSHNNVVPLWTFRKDLTIVPSVNATVPGAVTVTTPAQDAAGAVTATLTYVDTSGQLLSKAARTGTTVVSIVSGVKKTVDTRFYPNVSACLTNIGSHNLIIFGQTEVHLCDGSGHAIANPDGYSVTSSSLGTTDCTGTDGLCPLKASGPVINGLPNDLPGKSRIDITVTDTYVGAKTWTGSPYAGKGFVVTIARDISTASHADSQRGTSGWEAKFSDMDKASAAMSRGPFAAGTAAGSVNPSTLREILKYNLTLPPVSSPDLGLMTGGTRYTFGNPSSIVGGGDKAPALYVGSAYGAIYGSSVTVGSSAAAAGKHPDILFYFNRGYSAEVGVYGDDTTKPVTNGSAGYYHADGWNVDDALKCNNWLGTPYDQHPCNGDTRYPFLTQVNYVNGEIAYVVFR